MSSRSSALDAAAVFLTTRVVLPQMLDTGIT
jgi:hypothetical protein